MTHAGAIAWLESLEKLGIRPGLERITALLRRLGDPQRAYPSVIVGGTNGKGSVAAFLGSILREAGHAAGLYTSPHLVRLEERMAVGDRFIGETEVAEIADDVRHAVETGIRAGEEPVTYFEATTAMAFVHFRRHRVPIAVLEVGMGGRYDATNVVSPRVSVITPLALDHTQWLGPTLGAIARQKAGIMRPGVPCVVSRQEPEAWEVIRAEASAIGAPILRVADCRLQPPRGAPAYDDPPVFDMVTPAGVRYVSIALRLRGSHQVENAAAAVLAAEVLAASGFPVIDRSRVVAGLARTVWPGRIEFQEGRPDLLLDGAHNPAGCRTLAAYLRDYRGGRRAVLVFSAMRDKPAGEMLDILAPLAAEIIVTPVRVGRGEAPEVLGRLASDRHARVRQAADTAAALDHARAAAGTDGLVVVTGSLYLVGEAKQALGQPVAFP